MTAPAITISPNATVSAAARLMNTHHIRRLPVTDSSGKLAGIVSRRDLLSVFLRPDEDITTDIRKILDEILLVTVMEILAIDLGTDTLPALALSREPAGPGLMDRPPRKRTDGVISRGMLARAWGFLGLLSATLVMARHRRALPVHRLGRRRDPPRTHPAPPSEGEVRMRLTHSIRAPEPSSPAK